MNNNLQTALEILNNIDAKRNDFLQKFGNDKPITCPNCKAQHYTSNEEFICIFCNTKIINHERD